MAHGVSYITIIIPAHNEHAYLAGVLTSIKEQITTVDYETIVAVSPTTTDDTREIAYNLGARVVEGGRVGHARNNAARAARKESRILIFMDADVRMPTNDFLQKGLQEFAARNLDIATCFMKLDGAGARGVIEMLIFWFYHYFELLTEKHRAFPIGAFMIMKPEVLEVRGYNNCWGFDEDLSFAEDTELGQRALNAGKKYGIIRQTIIASDRRFKNKGIGRMLWEYVYRGVALFFGYEFRYSKKSKNYFD